MLGVATEEGPEQRHNGDSHVCLLITKIQLALMSPIYFQFVPSIELYLSLLST